MLSTRCPGTTFTSRRKVRSGLVITLILLLAGCVRFEWRRELRFEPPDLAVIETLEAGKTDLTQTLQKLGAPLWVWEYPSSTGQGAALAYGWYKNQDRELRVSAPVSRAVSPSFSYGRVNEKMRGIVLFFDETWMLTSWREGYLQDLTAGLGKRRPTYIEEEALNPKPTNE